MHDPGRWRRRALSISLFTVAGLLASASLPFALPVVAAIDGIRGRRFVLARALLFIVFFFWMEILGVLAAAALWIGVRGRRFEIANHALQRWWARSLFSALKRLYNFRIETEGHAPTGGPLLFFPRHVSTADTLLPMTLLALPYGFQMRYVLKAELLWDPCLDIVGQRIPNAFIRRGGADREREIARIRSLAADLGERQAVVIYPEGTRFTRARRERLQEKYAGEPLGAQATALRHTLPPRLGGPMALLDAAPDAEVIFCGHIGFEGVTRIGSLFDGALIDRQVRARFWRVPAAEVPIRREERERWLFERWAEIDAWIEGELFGAKQGEETSTFLVHKVE